MVRNTPLGRIHLEEEFKSHYHMDNFCKMPPAPLPNIQATREWGVGLYAVAAESARVSNERRREKLLM